MKLHANARTCPHCRSVIVMRVLEYRQSPSKVAADFRVSHRTVHKWIRRYKAEGTNGLKDKTSAPHTVPRKLVQPGKELTGAVMTLLHAPPSQSGFNRTTWRTGDLRNVLAERGIATTQNSIRTIIKRAGVRWRQARISLTSTDPAYREKLDAIKSVLGNLGADEAFFSIDALGPVAVKMRGGRSLQPPVLLGLVASLARPGGNVTGYSNAAPETTAKELSLLKELIPRLRRVGMMWQLGNPYYRATRGRVQDICRGLGLEADFVELAAAGEIGSAIAQLVRQGTQALILPRDGFVWDHRVEIVEAATKHGLATMADDDDMVRDAEALLAYAVTQVEQDRRSAEYIDRVLRGAKPSDLPVQQPSKFVLVINLRTAKALGLTIPKELLLRADEVIR
jgi:transposase